MKIILIVVCSLSPVIGVVFGFILANRMYPERSIPTNATRIESQVVLGQGAFDVSQRLDIAYWSIIYGAAIGGGLAFISYFRHLPIRKQQRIIADYENQKQQFEEPIDSLGSDGEQVPEPHSV